MTHDVPRVRIVASSEVTVEHKVSSMILSHEMKSRRSEEGKAEQ